jgi:hypothetical protein
LAEIRYPTVYAKDRAEALEKILSLHLLPESETQKNKSAEDSRFRDLIYEEDVKIMLNSVFPVIKDIYDFYFGTPFKKGRTLVQITQIASKQILAFVKDFDLLKNNFISKQTAIAILENLVQINDESLTNNPEDPYIFFALTDTEGNPLNQKYGVFFTLNRFFIFIFWTSIIGFDAINANHSQYSQSGIFTIQSSAK